MGKGSEENKGRKKTRDEESKERKEKKEKKMREEEREGRDCLLNRHRLSYIFINLTDSTLAQLQYSLNLVIFFRSKLDISGQVPSEADSVSEGSMKETYQKAHSLS